MGTRGTELAPVVDDKEMSGQDAACLTKLGNKITAYQNKTAVDQQQANDMAHICRVAADEKKKARASQQNRMPQIRFASFTDIEASSHDVRFSPKKRTSELARITFGVVAPAAWRCSLQYAAPG